MHRVTLRIFLALLTIAFMLRADDAAKTRVALARDTTVTDAAGWGAAFAKLLGPGAEVMAKIIAEELRRVSPDLAKLLK